MDERFRTIEAAIKRIIDVIGDDPHREGLQATPRRVAESLLYLTRGYRDDVSAEIDSGLFPAENQDVVELRDMEFHSLCEHHILPFYGHVSVVYVPGEHLIGISKIARVVDHFAARLQVQERMTAQIADLLNETLRPAAVGVLVKAKHLCMSSREYRKADAIMVTRAVRHKDRDALFTVESMLNRMA